MEKQKTKGQIYLIVMILVCMGVIAVLGVHQYIKMQQQKKIEEYRMTDEELKQYRSAIAEYDRISEEAGELISRKNCWDEYEDEKYLQYDRNGKMIYNDRYIRLRNEEYETYQKLFEIEFPQKYQQMYRQTVLLQCIISMSTGMGAEAFDARNTDLEDYYPDRSIGDRIRALEEQLHDPDYVPEEIDNTLCEEIYAVIMEEYDSEKILENYKYKKIRKLLYQEEFLKLVKKKTDPVVWIISIGLLGGVAIAGIWGVLYIKKHMDGEEQHQTDEEEPVLCQVEEVENSFPGYDPCEPVEKQSEPVPAKTKTRYIGIAMCIIGCIMLIFAFKTISSKEYRFYMDNYSGYVTAYERNLYKANIHNWDVLKSGYSDIAFGYKDMARNAENSIREHRIKALILCGAGIVFIIVGYKIIKRKP